MTVTASHPSGQSELVVGRRSRRAFVKFGAIGASGLIVNTAAMAFFSSVLSIHYLIGAILATQASTAWNFYFSDRFVFGRVGGGLAYLLRYGQFAALNNSSLLARGPLLVVFTEWFGINYLISNVLSLGLFTVLRFVISERMIWRSSPLRPGEPARPDDEPTAGTEPADHDLDPYELVDRLWLGADEGASDSSSPSGWAVPPALRFGADRGPISWFSRSGRSREVAPATEGPVETERVDEQLAPVGSVASVEGGDSVAGGDSVEPVVIVDTILTFEDLESTETDLTVDNFEIAWTAQGSESVEVVERPEIAEALDEAESVDVASGERPQARVAVDDLLGPEPPVGDALIGPPSPPGGRAWPSIWGRVARPAADVRWSFQLPDLRAASVVGSSKKTFWVSAGCLLIVALPAIWFRLVALDAVGLNSDEIVYGGQGASISGDPVLIRYFPIFRAHPLLFQTTLSLVFRGGVSGFAGRATAAAFGVATIIVVFAFGRALYGNLVGFFSALLLAVMPYHVVVSRQILLDGPMVFFSTLGLYLVARYASSDRPLWLYSAAAAFGLMFITNERSIVLFGGIYGFFAMSAERAIPIRRLVTSGLILILVALPYPLSIKYSGRSSTGEQFLAWQLFRRANHTAGFYLSTIPSALGLAILCLAIGGLILARRRSWKEALLLWWIAIPVGFFQLWNVKGYQYLLPIAPAVAILAGRTLGMITVAAERYRWASVPRLLAVAVVVISLVTPARSAWHLIDPDRPADQFVAGTGGVPGGREAGQWVRENVPEGATLMAIGPSMANIIQYYGDRKTYGLSVSTNPLHRNPVYEPVVNPDLQLRSSEIQYLVWDSFSAGRSEFFSDKLLTFVERYHGRTVHTEFIKTGSGDGVDSLRPVIIIYEVRP